MMMRKMVNLLRHEILARLFSLTAIIGFSHLVLATTFVDFKTEQIEGNGFSGPISVALSSNHEKIYAIGSDDDALRFFSLNTTNGDIYQLGIIENNDSFLTGVVSMYTVNETLLVPSTKKSAIVEFSMSGDTPSVLRSFGKPEETPESSAVTSIGTLLYVACANGISIYASSRTFLTSVSADDALICIASSYSEDKIIAASTQSLFIYARDGSGSLSLASKISSMQGIQDIAVSPDANNYIYVAYFENGEFKVQHFDTEGNPINIIKVEDFGFGLSYGSETQASLSVDPETGEVYWSIAGLVSSVLQLQVIADKLTFVQFAYTSSDLYFGALACLYFPPRNVLVVLATTDSLVSIGDAQRTPIPTATPTTSPTTDAPSQSPTTQPSYSPTHHPVDAPLPSYSPTASPLSASPTLLPTALSTALPTASPSLLPTTRAPTTNATSTEKKWWSWFEDGENQIIAAGGGGLFFLAVCALFVVRKRGGTKGKTMVQVVPEAPNKSPQTIDHSIQKRVSSHKRMLEATKAEQDAMFRVFNGFESFVRMIPFIELSTIASLGPAYLGIMQMMQWYSERVHGGSSQEGDRLMAKHITRSYLRVPVLARIRKELEIYAKLKPHLNVQRLVGISFDVPPNLILAFEGGHEMTLQHLLYGSDIDEEELLPDKVSNVSWTHLIDIAIGVSRGLVFLHSHSYPHYDIRPANILVDASHKNAKIGNLMEVRMASIAGKRLFESKHPEYLAPEVLQEELFDEKIDIYSFGIMLNEMDCREPPYTESISRSVSFDVVGSTFKSRRPTMHHRSGSSRKLYESPDALKKIIVRCWQTNPRLRPSAKIVQEQLEDVKRLIHKQAPMDRKLSKRSSFNARKAKSMNI